MSVVAVIKKPDDVGLVVRWSADVAAARKSKLTVLCWASAPSVKYPLLSSEEEIAEVEQLAAKVREFCRLDEAAEGHKVFALPAADIEIQRVLHPDVTKAAIEHVRRTEADVLVVASPDPTGQTGAAYNNHPLLRQSPCATLVLFQGKEPAAKKARVFLMGTDSPHDVTGSTLAARLAVRTGALSIIARVEEGEEEAIEVGRRELRQLLRTANVKRHERVRRRVFLADDRERLASAIDKCDLVLVGANNQAWVRGVMRHKDHPTIGVVKQAPPLRIGQKRRNVNWQPRMNPADYADLVQTLRTGSKLNADFLTMLGLAAAIASWGLLQDSPAVVIGSMLLAPLMTPMIAIGLAMAQANPKFGRKSMGAVLVGFLVTLLVSTLIGLFTPGRELTAQVLSRGEPNLLDLGIALASGAAAAYALARPNLVGAVAGVAIATALVPPLCSIGISMAYGNFGNAQGAGVLFVTNLVAIIIGAAATFRLLGVSPQRKDLIQRQWVFRMVFVLALAVIVLAFPLEHALQRSIDRGKPQPRTFPLTKAVEESLAEHVSKSPRIELVSTGRPSSSHATADVIIVLASPEDLPEYYADKLIEIVHREMEDDTLRVRVHCLLEAWQEPRETAADSATTAAEDVAEDVAEEAVEAVLDEKIPAAQQPAKQPTPALQKSHEEGNRSDSSAEKAPPNEVEKPATPGS